MAVHTWQAKYKALKGQNDSVSVIYLSVKDRKEEQLCAEFP